MTAIYNIISIICVGTGVYCFANGETDKATLFAVLALSNRIEAIRREARP